MSALKPVVTRRAFETSRRREVLAFKHHAEVAALDPVSRRRDTLSFSFHAEVAGIADEHSVSRRRDTLSFGFHVEVAGIADEAEPSNLSIGGEP
jgi:hypothetical protein